MSTIYVITATHGTRYWLLPRAHYTNEMASATCEEALVECSRVRLEIHNWIFKNRRTLAERRADLHFEVNEGVRERGLRRGHLSSSKHDVTICRTTLESLDPEWLDLTCYMGESSLYRRYLIDSDNEGLWSHIETDALTSPMYAIHQVELDARDGDRGDL